MDYVDTLIKLIEDPSGSDGLDNKDLLVWTAREALRKITNPKAKEKLRTELKKYSS